MDFRQKMFMLTHHQLHGGGENLQNNTSTNGSLFIHLNLLNNLIYVKVQMFHTFIVQNVETLTWRHFRSHDGYIPSLISIEMHNPF